MDKNILDFINLAKSKDDTRHHLCHAYANEKHIVSLDGHRMHYVDNVWGIKGFLAGGMAIDAQFPNYEKLITDSSVRINLIQSALTVSSWKLLLKELKTFETVQFTVRNGSVALNAFSGVQSTPWQKQKSPITKTLSVLMPLADNLYDSQGPFLRASYLADALSPILYRKRDSESLCVLVSWEDTQPVRISCYVNRIAYHSVLMPILNLSDDSKHQVAA